MFAGLNSWQSALASVGFAAGTGIVGLILYRVVYILARRVTAFDHGWWAGASAMNASLVRRSQRPARLIFPLAAIVMALSLLPEDTGVVHSLGHAVGIGLIAAFAWLLVAMVDVLDDLAALKYRMDVQDNLTARRLRTQVQVLRRIAVVVVSVVALAAILMTFPNIRRIGESLFASAGLAALVAGLAARPTLTSVIAGIQIALTEPISLDDVVIVEGEWGRIEEIGTTYVVVRIWDQRRLVVPLTYFIENPFENWTRKSAEILGTVYFYTDYNVPVDELRSELHRVLEQSGKWDGRVWSLQVTDATPQSMELRAVVSAPDSSVAWDLRCLVREELIRFVRQRYPESLPRTRAEIHDLGSMSLRGDGRATA